MFHYFSVESRVPADHPLRRVKKLADTALPAILGEFDGLYAKTGRPSIPSVQGPIADRLVLHALGSTVLRATRLQTALLLVYRSGPVVGWVQSIELKPPGRKPSRNRHSPTFLRRSGMPGPKGQAALLRSLCRGWHLLIDAWAFF